MELFQEVLNQGDSARLCGAHSLHELSPGAQSLAHTATQSL